jgi:hypothetical protein
MQSAKYEANAKGQMELVMERCVFAPNETSLRSTSLTHRIPFRVSRYLDTFPFETYVVLRDVSALPEVLSGVLRQWMERIAEQ